MLIAALFMGALVAYYYGLRVGLWVAAGTMALLMVPTFVPRALLPVYLALAALAAGVQIVGSRRARPAGTVRAVRWVTARTRTAHSLWRMKRRSE